MKIIRIVPVLAAALLVCSALLALPLPANAVSVMSAEKGAAGLFDDEPAPPPPLSTTIPPAPLSSDPLATQTTTEPATQVPVVTQEPAASQPLQQVEAPIEPPAAPAPLTVEAPVVPPAVTTQAVEIPATVTPPPPLSTTIAPAPLSSDPLASQSTLDPALTQGSAALQIVQSPGTPPPPNPAAPGHPPFPPGPGHPPFPPGPGYHPPFPPYPPYPNPYPYTYPWGQWPYYYRWSTFVTPSYRTPIIIESPVYAPVISSFTANPNYVQPGQSTVLSWNISNSPTSINIYPSVGSVPASGVYTVTPGNTTTFTLSASNGAGTVTASTTVTVAPLVTSYYNTSSTVAAAPVTTVVTSDTGTTANLWWLSAVLIGLLAVAAAVIVFLAVRRPSPAMAGTRAGYFSSNSVTTPATDSPHTTPVPAGARAKFISTGGGELGLAGGFRSLGRNDLRPMLSAGKADLISRQHLQVDYQDGVYYVEDRSSTNGTRLNGEFIKGKGRYVLKNGDNLELADAITLTFKD